MKVKQTITSVGATLFLLIFVLVTVSGQNEKSFSGDKKAFNKALNFLN